jgi:hypothetical protein
MSIFTDSPDSPWKYPPIGKLYKISMDYSEMFLKNPCIFFWAAWMRKESSIVDMTKDCQSQFRAV